MYCGSPITSVVDAVGRLRAFEDDATSGIWPNSSPSNLTYDVHHNFIQTRSCNSQVDSFPEICCSNFQNDMAFNTTHVENGIVITTDALFAEDATVIPLHQDNTEESLNNVTTDGKYCSSYNTDSVTTVDGHSFCNNIAPNKAEDYCRYFYKESSTLEGTCRYYCNMSETTTNKHHRLFNKSPIITGEFYCPNNKVPIKRTAKCSFLPYNQIPSVFLKDVRTHANSSNQTTIGVNCTKMSKSFKKRPSCPIQLESKRALANKQERLRMYRLNTALEKLRQAIPESFQELWSYNKRRSKIRTLRLAICYITVLKDALQKCSGN